MNVLNGVIPDFFTQKINIMNKKSKKRNFNLIWTLDYRSINFTMKTRDYEIIKERFNINVNVFGYENRVFPLYVSKNQMNKY